MVVICHLMRVVLEGVHHIHDVFMGMAMVFDLGLMLRHDLRNLGKIMRLTLHVRGQADTHHQNDGRRKAQKCQCLSYHLPVSASLGPLALSPWGG